METRYEFYSTNENGAYRLFLQDSKTGKRLFITDLITFPSLCETCGRDHLFGDEETPRCAECEDATVPDRIKCKRCGEHTLASAIGTTPCAGCISGPPRRVHVFEKDHEYPHIVVDIPKSCVDIPTVVLQSVNAYTHYQFDTLLSDAPRLFMVGEPFCHAPFIKKMIASKKSTIGDLIGNMRMSEIIDDTMLVTTIFPNFFPATATFGLLCGKDSIGPSHAVTMADILNPTDYVIVPATSIPRKDLDEPVSSVTEGDGELFMCTRDEVKARSLSSWLVSNGCDNVPAAMDLSNPGPFNIKDDPLSALFVVPQGVCITDHETSPSMYDARSFVKYTFANTTEKELVVKDVSKFVVGEVSPSPTKRARVIQEQDMEECYE